MNAVGSRSEYPRFGPLGLISSQESKRKCGSTFSRPACARRPWHSKWSRCSFLPHFLGSVKKRRPRPSGTMTKRNGTFGSLEDISWLMAAMMYSRLALMLLWTPATLPWSPASASVNL